MFIREYTSSDCQEIMDLFYQTVHTVNAKDYTPEQLDAWAPQEPDAERWNDSFLKHYTLAAVENGRIVGFGDIDSSGYLDRLYVHASCQGQGAATALCDRLEQSCGGRITTHASITAKPFFESRGYHVVKRQTVERRGVRMTNFVMEKDTGMPRRK
jgi:putative acetyltransferase